MKIVTIITLLILGNLVNGQSLQGKWFLTKEGDTYTVPSNMIMEFKNDSIIYYDFDKRYISQKIQINPDQTFTGSKSLKRFEFINPERLKMTINGIVNEKDSIFFQEYVRLLPTETDLTSEEITDLKFKFKYRGSDFTIKFNKELTSPEVLRIMQKDEYQKMHLEKIDSTYFVSIYRSGKRENVIPIEEVTSKKMVLYGVPSKPYKIKGKLID